MVKKKNDITIVSVTYNPDIETAVKGVSLCNIALSC